MKQDQPPPEERQKFREITAAGSRDALRALAEPAFLKRPNATALPVSQDAIERRSKSAAAMVLRSGAEGSTRPKGGSLRPADIFTIRVTAGLTQRQLAALLGSNEGRVTRLEHGTLEPLRFETWLLEVISLAMAPMVNQKDRYAWARKVAEVAESDLSEGMAMIFADGARWRRKGSDR